MDILIKDPATNLFLNDKALWVQAEAEARRFLLPLDALKFCVEHDIKGMELNFRYPGECVSTSSEIYVDPFCPASGVSALG